MTTPNTIRPNATGRWRRPPARVVAGVALVVLAVVFILQNRQPTSIRVILPVVTMPLWAALTGMLVVGTGIGLVISRRH